MLLFIVCYQAFFFFLFFTYNPPPFLLPLSFLAEPKGGGKKTQQRERGGVAMSRGKAVFPSRLVATVTFYRAGPVDQTG